MYRPLGWSRALSIQFIFYFVHFPSYTAHFFLLDCRSILPAHHRHKVLLRQPGTEWIYFYIFIHFSMLRTLKCCFFPPTRPGFLMSREKYYTHAVGRNIMKLKEYYWFLWIRETLHNPQFYYEEKCTILHYIFVFFFSFIFFRFSFDFLCFPCARNEFRRRKTSRKLLFMRRLMKAEGK